jgi:hypothetical protein
MKFLIVDLLHSPFSSLLGQNIFQILLACVRPFCVRDYANQPYSRTGNIIVLYIVIIKFLEKIREDKCVWTE